ncbi:MAG: FAD-linked oxidase C-terminal domain-containing protein [Phreatobacter sp.]|uniref:FAD-binding oxidoreductase n=1 Tax=Phreatobacter sp. TaxID=1966341 RepID=UPI002734DFCD|nr:FAD-linked oxidase C-terminal domain-containing protein [Phreatobacter sp.]MDP2800674.1 FAD-linked oxidase C-terminal domain-containing protein [Phreatobacter sp.]
MNAPLAASAIDPVLLEGLRTLLGSRVSTSESDRAQHGRDESRHAPRLPDAVCRAVTTEEVAAIVRLCAAHDTPIVAYGAGSSLEGALIPVNGGVSLDLTGMNQILGVRAEDLDATVQAGVTRMQLNAHLRDTGLFFPVDPGAVATIGGMAATRASGTNAVRYGTMRENVVNLTVVLSDGRVIRTRSRAKKSSAGYDLTGLFVGQEGTLGIITEVTVRLYGIPEVMAAATCSFPSVDAAVDTVIQTIQMGIPISRVELLDDRAIEAVNAYSKLTLPVTPTLFFEFAGSQSGVEEQASIVEDLARGEGASNWRWSTDADERAKLWQARHDIHWAIRALRPGAKGWGTDVCVPISALAEVIREVRKETSQQSFGTTLVGHVGDGNFHLGMQIDPDDPAEWAKANEINDRMVKHAIALGGTCTGEHGVGIGKMKFMREEHGEALDVMYLIKNALDPKGIFNPGKVLPS